MPSVAVSLRENGMDQDKLENDFCHMFGEERSEYFTAPPIYTVFHSDADYESKAWVDKFIT